VEKKIEPAEGVVNKIMRLNEAVQKIRLSDLNMRSSNRVLVGSSMSKKQRGIKAYGAARDEQVKQTTDPETLIKLLFDKACVLIRTSTESLDREDHESFQKSCLHALQIVLSLRFVLKTEDGDELSKSLFDTYTAIAASLFKAKENKDSVALSKIYEALNELRVAWAVLLSAKE
jgi:flagellar biosynthetic protein FliS